MSRFVHFRRYWSGRPSHGLRRFVPIVSTAPVEASPISAASRRLAKPPWAWVDHAPHSEWRNPRRFVPIISTAKATTTVFPRAKPWSWDAFYRESPARSPQSWRNPRRFVPRTETAPFVSIGEASRRVARRPWDWAHHVPYGLVDWRNPRRFVPIVSTFDTPSFAPSFIYSRRMAVPPWRWAHFAPFAEWRNPRGFLPIVSTPAEADGASAPFRGATDLRRRTGDSALARRRGTETFTIARPTPVLDMPMQDNADTAAVDDVSASDNNGTLSADTSADINVQGPTSLLPRALDYASHNALLPSQVNASGASPPSTIAFWAKRPNTAEHHYIVRHASGQSFVRFDRGGHVLRVRDGLGISATRSPGVSTTDWHHYAIVIDNNDGSPVLYVDGALVGTFTGLLDDVGLLINQVGV